MLIISMAQVPDLVFLRQHSHEEAIQVGGQQHGKAGLPERFALRGSCEGKCGEADSAGEER